MTKTRRRNRRIVQVARAAAALVLVLGLSGCIKLDIDLTLDGDQVDGSMIIGVNRALLEMTGSSVEDFLDEIDAGDEIPEGATAQPYEDDEYVGREYMLSGVDVTEFDSEAVSISYDADAGTYEVTGEMDMSELGDQAAELGEFDMSVSITFPGEVTDHNGELDGRTVTWTPAFGEVNEIHATARDDGGSGVAVGVLVALAALGAVLVAGLAVFLARRSRESEPGEVDEAGEPDDASEPDDADQPTA